MRRHTIAVGIGIALISAACAGRQFVRPRSETLVLGTTTRAEVTKQLGQPAGQFDVVRNGRTLTGIGYRYITMFGRPNVYPERVMRFFFLDDVLVGYDYSSSYVEDKTDFEEDHVYRMKKGETTRAQVIDLLGQPGGMYIYPMISSTNDTALVYRYYRKKHEPFKGLRILDKVLVISIDGRDVISGVDHVPGAAQ